jgi:SAM-dependent methyltransferase|uniref:Methyltransferase type 11 domain-containing protein n=1 Tax=Phaeodactylum tricornutum TaxID=2850 RepID=A0A8J9TDI9_PHATR
MIVNESKAASLIPRTLGDSTYALRASPTISRTRAIFKAAGSIVALPLMVPMSLIWSAAMATPLRDHLMGIVIPRVMTMVDKEFHDERATLLADVSGKVLDVGSGGGAYLKYCRNANEVIAVEPILDLHPKIQKSGQDVKKLTIVSQLEDIHDDELFDWVIFGNVLCEVPDVPNTIREVDRVLKPGGRVYFSEHIARPQGDWRRTCQDMVNPVWRHMGGGCNCNRDSLKILESQPGWAVVSWKYEHIQVGMGPFVLGLAMKSPPNHTPELESRSQQNTVS